MENKRGKIETHANNIIDEILSKNRKTFDIFKGSPMQVPIRVTSKGIDQVYLNTGTWQARHIKGLGGGFITIKNLTYTIIYSQEENQYQQFETWTGSLKEVLSA